jgi:predicted DNA-binding protein
MRHAPATKKRQRLGRPPSGARLGEKVVDYPQVSVRLPPEMKAKLQALSRVRRRPQWRVLAEAIECYYKEHSAGERRSVDQLMRRKER